MSHQIDWPDCFENNEINYRENKNCKALALADAGMAWGIVMSGHKPKENFGPMLVELGLIVGTVLTPENVSRLSDKWLAEIKK